MLSMSDGQPLDSSMSSWEAEVTKGHSSFVSEADLTDVLQRQTKQDPEHSRQALSPLVLTNLVDDTSVHLLC